MYDYLEDDRYLKDKQLQSHTRMERYNHSTIHDAGYSVEFDYRPNGKHHIRFGSNYLYHLFRPQSQASKNLSGNQEEADSIWSRSRNIHRGHELSVYAEDDVTLAVAEGQCRTSVHTLSDKRIGLSLSGTSFRSQLSVD